MSYKVARFTQVEHVNIHISKISKNGVNLLLCYNTLEAGFLYNISKTRIPLSLNERTYSSTPPPPHIILHTISYA